MSTVKIGIDIGGTNIKLGAVDENYKILKKLIVPTPKGTSGDELADFIAQKCREVSEGFSPVFVGIGVPGLIDSGKVDAVNLNFKKYPLSCEIQKRVGIKTKVSNDANAASLGEYVAGVSKNCKNVLTITLGTGIGSGIIINGKIYEGFGSAGEAGHLIIVHGGKKCPCGQRGCWERYASASVLIEEAEKSAKNNPESILGKKYIADGRVGGISFFDAVKEGCPVALKCLDKYTDYVADGLNSLIFIFNPEMIVISGGISNAGDLLLDPIKKKIKDKKRGLSD